MPYISKISVSLFWPIQTQIPSSCVSQACALKQFVLTNASTVLIWISKLSRLQWRNPKVKRPFVLLWIFISQPLEQRHFKVSVSSKRRIASTRLQSREALFLSGTLLARKRLFANFWSLTFSKREEYELGLFEKCIVKETERKASLVHR